MRIRELTGKEKQEIRRLVKTMCANYDEKYRCLPLNGDCYMFYGYGYTNTAIKLLNGITITMAMYLYRFQAAKTAPFC